MKHFGWGLGLWTMVTTALVQQACSDSADKEPIVHNAAGDAGGDGVGHAQGGEGGGAESSGGYGGGAEHAGQAGAAAGQGGGEADCVPPTLDEVCEERECPAGPTDFNLEESCGFRNGFELAVDRYESDCGTTIVLWGDKRTGFEYFSRTYSFDAEGVLIGFSSGTDIADACVDAGTICQPEGEPQTLCPELGAGGHGGAGGAGG